jgi:hypothetical protein
MVGITSFDAYIPWGNDLGGVACICIPGNELIKK